MSTRSGKRFDVSISSKVEQPPFTPHPGPAHLHEPLGQSILHDHYITPVPPTYVTEYEEAYKWPIPLSSSKRGASPLTESQLSPWVLMEQALRELEEAGYETHVDTIITEIKQKRLHPLIEAAYEDSKGHLSDKKHDYPKDVINLYKVLARAVEDIKQDIAGPNVDKARKEERTAKENSTQASNKKKKTG